ncbi:hypothetical protein TNIN_413791 [Trichonephila inaurata madagascariensis]|uniref:Uncharacterized protein n=1 Tax=Trichonephila inaurata madagascariensis TaxID=2747483 RepID=A0A8X6XLX8_9ARAC|nr:hypothetical protein TNIN_453991 [Trichonephila inaurata madagascariensis]GFY55573.1 hypothetical protein TNIN_413791 [Trichonephila inaurata madagascariensis]
MTTGTPSWISPVHGIGRWGVGVNVTQLSGQEAADMNASVSPENNKRGARSDELLPLNVKGRDFLQAMGYMEKSSFCKSGDLIKLLWAESQWEESVG